MKPWDGINDSYSIFSDNWRHIFEFLSSYERTHLPEGECVGENMVITMSEFTRLNSHLCYLELGSANYPSRWQLDQQVRWKVVGLIYTLEMSLNKK